MSNYNEYYDGARFAGGDYYSADGYRWHMAGLAIVAALTIGIIALCFAVTGKGASKNFLAQVSSSGALTVLRNTLKLSVPAGVVTNNVFAFTGITAPSNVSLLNGTIVATANVAAAGTCYGGNGLASVSGVTATGFTIVTLVASGSTSGAFTATAEPFFLSITVPSS